MMFFAMRARNAADTADVSWVASCFPDPAGDEAPEAISGTGVVEGHWGDRGESFFGMRARNAADSAFVGWTTDFLDTAGVDAGEAISGGTAVNEGDYTSGVEYPPPARDEYQPGVASDNFIVWPLTYDEEDSDGFHHLTRLASAFGPHITPDGLQGNNYNSVYSIATPSWQTTAAADLSLHAIASVDVLRVDSLRKVVAAVSMATDVDTPKVEIASINDIVMSDNAQVAVRYRATTTQTLRCNRAQWRFEFRYPELVNGNVPSAQALCWLDSTTLLISCHESDSVTPLYRVDMSTGEYTGKALSTVYTHIGSLHLNADGHLWGTDNYTGGAGYSAFRVDLERSFICGEIETLATWDTSDIEANAGIDFITVAGTDYVLLQQYKESGTAHLYVFTTTQMSAPVVQADRFKRFNLGLRVQDIKVRASDGLLYASRNVRTGDPSPQGWIQTYDIAAAIAGSADGATLTAISSYPHAGEYAEGLDFHPVTDRLYSSTEGLSAVADQLSNVAVWSCSIPQVPETNVYVVDYDGGTDLLEVRINGRLMHSITADLTATPAQVNIGGHAPAAVTWDGTSVGGDSLVRAVAIKDGPFTEAELDDLQADAYEPHELTEYPVTITNPGAESSTTGWTLDTGTGTLLVGTTTPTPYAGAGFFYGGNSVNGAYRQRFTIATASGLSSDQIEELCTLSEMFGMAGCQQASFDGTSDPGGVGIRSLTAANATVVNGIAVATTGAGIVTTTPSLTWRPRFSATAFTETVRGFDILQSRVRTAGTNVDCYVDEITTTLYAQDHDTGTTVISSITTLNDASSTNADLTSTGGNPLSVKGPMGTDFSRAFGGTRRYVSGANTGPNTTLTGTDYTWEAMVFMAAWPAAGTVGTLYLVGNEAGTDATAANNTLLRVALTSTGTVRIFSESGSGVNASFDTALDLPIGRWVHLRVRGLTNGANRDFTVHMTDAEGPVTLGTGSLTLATSGTARIVEISQSTNQFIGKLAYMRLSNTDRGSSDLQDCFDDPATNIANDGSTTAFYSMQDRS